MPEQLKKYAGSCLSHQERREIAGLRTKWKIPPKAETTNWDVLVSETRKVFFIMNWLWIFLVFVQLVWSQPIHMVFIFLSPKTKKKGNIELSQLMTEYTSLLGTLHTSQIHIPLDCCIQNSMMIQSNLGYATYSNFCFKTRIERRQNKSTKKYAYRPFVLVSLLICFNIKHPPERK